MAHYAFLDDSNIVTEVITGKDETELIDGLTPEQWYGNYRGQTCIRTSYNNNIRYNYAGIGYTYDPIDDAFIAPMPICGHDSLLLDNNKRWQCSECEALHEASTL
jgi:hypothetical protein